MAKNNDLPDKEIKLFDFLKAMTQTKKDLTDDYRFEKSYNPFIINRFLSCHAKTIFLANFISRYPNIPKDMQFKFFLSTIDKEKLFFKYQKKELLHDKKTVDMIKKVYNVGIEKAYELLAILSDDQVKMIEKSFGGKK